MDNKILVVGSLVEDLIVKTNTMPNEGETIFGDSFSQADGGKGANQAVQASRLGASVKMVGKVGGDTFAKTLLNSCKSSGINVDDLVSDEGSSGISSIILNKDKNGNYQNRIIMTPGANSRLTVDDVKFLENSISDYKYLILQFEIPTEVNEYLAELAHKNGVTVIVNPAPSKPISDKFIKNITYLVPNEHEFFDLTGINFVNNGQIDKDAILKGADILFKKGLENLVITLGDKGSCLINKNGALFIDSIKNVKSVDPTAAGDSFIGAFAFGLSKEMKIEDSLLLANAVGSLTVQRMGAMPSLCTDKELKAYLEGLNDPKYQKLASILSSTDNQKIDHLKVFKDAIKEEFDNTLSSLNYEFYKDAYELILEAKRNNNRIHVTGIGKPSHIAQYFASLFSSTGTPSYYLHGTEAVHGSCGQLVKGDVVIAISNSGNTSELLNTLEAVKRNGCKVIGVSGNAESKLAKLSDVHLLAHINNEGGPLNRAPRASIMSEVLVLQGLSVLLQAEANIDPKQYVKWHPGGSLGQLRDNEKK